MFLEYSSLWLEKNFFERNKSKFELIPCLQCLKASLPNVYMKLPIVPTGNEQIKCASNKCSLSSLSVVLVLSVFHIITSCDRLFGIETQCTVELCFLFSRLTSSDNTVGSLSSKGKIHWGALHFPGASTRFPVPGDRNLVRSHGFVHL